MAKQLEINDTQIKALKPKQKTYTKHFGGGFYVFIHPNGRKVCRYCYQIDKKIKRYELGDYVAGKGKLKELLAEYHRVHTNRIHNKIDPVTEAEVQSAKAETEKRKLEAEALAEAGRMSLDDVAGAFLEKYQGLKGGKRPASRTMKDYRWHLEGYILPKFGPHPMDSLPVDMIMDWLDEIASDKPVMANRLFATLSVVCTWAKKQKRYQVRQNPFAGMDKPGGVEVPKNRVLDFKPKHRKFNDQGEIKRFWQWLEKINPAHAIAFKMILMTGQRPGEVLGLEWDDIYQNEIVLPAEKTKNKKDIHAIPTVPKLIALLDDLRNMTGKSGYLFPAMKSGRPTGESVKPATLSRLLSKALQGVHTDNRGKEHPAGTLHGIEKFTSHDLRRTCATHCGDLGFSMQEVGLLLNHTQGGVTAIYDQSDGTAKKLAMLTAWHHRLDQLTNGDQDSNVVAIR